jgi:hypothetical protein
MSLRRPTIVLGIALLLGGCDDPTCPDGKRLVHYTRLILIGKVLTPITINKCAADADLSDPE